MFKSLSVANVNKSSFRDPSGFVFEYQNQIYRQVNHCYAENYELANKSELFDSLSRDSLLIPHSEETHHPLQNSESYKIIKPERVPFISYPYEWSFSQLKQAALCTLEIQERALKVGMSLKDASAYNVQFIKTKAIFIDTLSFEKYHEGKPWGAYRQFCEHFVAPLALMAYSDVRLNALSKSFIDGIPLSLASSCLPLRSKFNFGILTHIFWHARAQEKLSNKVQNTKRGISQFALRALIDSLRSTINKLYLRTNKTIWGDYYSDTNYSKHSFDEKKQIVSEFLSGNQVKTIWDVGANTGVFSRIAAQYSKSVISLDFDSLAVEKNYQYCVENKIENIIPLRIDLINPTPAIGWANEERLSLLERAPADKVIALALIHHLAISNNVPLVKIAEFFAKCGPSLLIEFVSKEDSQVQRLLANREDIFCNYSEENFEIAFSAFFKLKKKHVIKDSCRTIYLFETK